MKQTVMILGTEYQIEIHKWSEDKVLSQNSWAGYCCSEIPLIVIADLDDEEHFWFSNDEEKMRTLRAACAMKLFMHFE